MLAVRRPRTGRTASRQLHACGSGSEVSLCQLLEHRLVELSFSEELLQPGVLALELLEPLRVVGLHAAVLGEPPSPGRLRDLELARSEEHTSELQSLMRTSYAVFCLKKKHTTATHTNRTP